MGKMFRTHEGAPYFVGGTFQELVAKRRGAKQRRMLVVELAPKGRGSMR